MPLRSTLDSGRKSRASRSGRFISPHFGELVRGASSLVPRAHHCLAATTQRESLAGRPHSVRRPPTRSATVRARKRKPDQRPLKRPVLVRSGVVSADVGLLSRRGRFGTSPGSSWPPSSPPPTDPRRKRPARTSAPTQGFTGQPRRRAAHRPALPQIVPVGARSRGDRLRASGRPRSTPDRRPGRRAGHRLPGEGSCGSRSISRARASRPRQA
jgi:hypothetical protein